MAEGPSACSAVASGGLSLEEEERSGRRSAGDLPGSEEDAVPPRSAALVESRRSADGSTPMQPGESPLRSLYLGLSASVGHEGRGVLHGNRLGQLLGKGAPQALPVRGALIPVWQLGVLQGCWVS